MSEDDHTIRTTHVGSLPRPPELLERLTEAPTGEQLTDPEIVDMVGDATEGVLRRQAEVGIDIANNGEQARTGFHLHVTDRLRGFGEMAPAPFWADVQDFPALAAREFAYPESDPETGAPLRPAVVEPIDYVGAEQATREVELLTEAAGAIDHVFEDLFMTSPSPGIVAASLPNRYYETFAEYLAALGDALAVEWEIIADAGLILQIDAPELLHTHHRAFPADQPEPLAEVDEYRQVVRRYVKTINEALPDVPPERLRLHTCWGNYPGPHHRDRPLEDVIEELYELEVGGLSIELSGSRHAHEVAVLADHAPPQELTIIPGVIDVKENAIDHPETVALRLERVVEAIGDPSRVIAAPNCGFGTLAWSAAAEEIAWEKLRALVAGARLASKRLA